MRLATLILICLLAFILFFTVPIAFASCTTQYLGDYALHSCDNVSGTSQRIGDYTFHSFTDGSSATTQRIGDTAITTYDPPLTMPMPSYDDDATADFQRQWEYLHR